MTYDVKQYEYHMSRASYFRRIALREHRYMRDIACEYMIASRAHIERARVIRNTNNA
jgi:hypothetical protein